MKKNINALTLIGVIGSILAETTKRVIETLTEYANKPEPETETSPEAERLAQLEAQNKELLMNNSSLSADLEELRTQYKALKDENESAQSRIDAIEYEDLESKVELLDKLEELDITEAYELEELKSKTELLDKLEELDITEAYELDDLKKNAEEFEVNEDLINECQYYSIYDASDLSDKMEKVEECEKFEKLNEVLDDYGICNKYELMNIIDKADERDEAETTINDLRRALDNRDETINYLGNELDRRNTLKGAFSGLWFVICNKVRNIFKKSPVSEPDERETLADYDEIEDDDLLDDFEDEE